MKTLVIDTSVQIKWLNQKDEQYIQAANKILQDALDDKVQLLSPELARYEVGNALLKGKQLSPEQAKTSLGTAYALPITFIPESQDIAKETYSIGHKLNITYYDASFLSLAKKYGADLITENIKDQKSTSGVKVIPLKDF